MRKQLILTPGPIVAWIRAGVIAHLVDGAPVRHIDPAVVVLQQAIRRRACDLDPAVLKAGHQADERNEFTRVLILAKDDRHIELSVVRRIQRIERQSNIDPFLFSAQERVVVEPGNVDCLFPVHEWTAVNPDATTAHHRQFSW